MHCITLCSGSAWICCLSIWRCWLSLLSLWKVCKFKWWETNRHCRVKLSNTCDSAKFGLFLMLFNSLYKLVLCTMRRLGFQNDRINAPIAGFISALSIAFDSKQRRMLFSVLILSRCLETCCNKAETAGLRIPYRSVVFWVLANCFLQSCYALESDLMNRGLAKFFGVWSQMQPNDKIQVEVWHRMW